ncbi:MAG: uracil-DNA glycosylase [Planctomycetes bacterium]|nr:uracil-DNA glycosylase [Planctomycetota bacterium]
MRQVDPPIAGSARGPYAVLRVKSPKYDVPEDPVLRSIARRVAACRRCPRLVQYVRESRSRWPDHYGAPVPGWGDDEPQLVIVGLAPGLHGANRTGRMFTFDASGMWLYATLHEMGLASRPISQGPRDGLRLPHVYITAALRCAPPENRPLPSELSACRSYLEEELQRFERARVILALGRIAHDQTCRALGLRGCAFSHGAEHLLGRGQVLLDSYHPSRQNTNTGRQTRSMWRAIFRRAKELMR